jgi:hypothetical protein
MHVREGAPPPGGLRAVRPRPASADTTPHGTGPPATRCRACAASSGTVIGDLESGSLQETSPTEAARTRWNPRARTWARSRGASRKEARSHQSPFLRALESSDQTKHIVREGLSLALASLTAVSSSARHPWSRAPIPEAGPAASRPSVGASQALPWSLFWRAEVG